ncbi:Purine-binding protein [Saezia sanguinis]|uniref:Purine-binding protein n=1 Tax=Saezia sanguinis TaxID=1965230 RepID=A0A433SGG7_9BURK|nr:BMP family ABC transporter substrate-binding protein [Saezia sanguinis]RUS67800.1 Purine-binding protein [Saezia sanguinis]
MTDMKKRTFIKLATFSAVAGAAGMLVGCGDSDKPAASGSGAAPASNPQPTPAPGNEPLKVGFVYIGPVGDGGWTYSHDLGRKHIVDVFGDKISTTYVESVPEGPDAERVIRDLVDQKCKLIYATSFGYMEPMVRVAADHPEVYFEHCTGYKTSANMRVYDHRLYETAYQAGVVAAYMTKTKVLGFVGTFPIPEVLRNINAFTLGARSVDPEIQVKVVWVNSWYDPSKEGEAANALFNGGADILLQNTDSSAVLQAAAKAGRFGFGWDSDMTSYAPEAHLGSCALNWGVYYEKSVNDVLNNTWQSGSFRWGAKEGLVQFVSVSDKVGEEARQRLQQVQGGLKDGSYSVFKGPIVDNTGTERLPAGQIADDEWNSKVDFLVQGVEGKVPSAS